MDKLFIETPLARSLLIIFSGWGFDLQMYRNLHKDDCDILVVGGYTDDTPEKIEKEILGAVGNPDRYSEVIVIGWSFGVVIASEFLSATTLPVTLRLAVNGTVSHIDDSEGIPFAIFNGTLAGLSDVTFRKFLQRCCGSSSALNSLCDNVMPVFSDEKTAQLRFFGNIAGKDRRSLHTLWDKVIIGRKDRIFPPENQQISWAGHDIYLEDDMYHTPDFQWIIDNFTISKGKVRSVFAKAATSYNENAAVQIHVARKLAELLDSCLPQSDRRYDILELGSGEGIMTMEYMRRLREDVARLTLVDLNRPAVSMATILSEQLLADDKTEIEEVAADVESATFAAEYLSPESYDIIISASMFQWLNSPAGMIRKASTALRNGGIIAVSCYGRDTFREISAITESGLKYPSISYLLSVAKESGLQVVANMEEEIPLTFANESEAVRHLKKTGVNGLAANTSRSKIKALLSGWPRNSAGDVTLTFNPFYIILRKP